VCEGYVYEFEGGVVYVVIIEFMIGFEFIELKCGLMLCNLELMLVILVKVLLFDDDDWGFEIKWDGICVCVYIVDECVWFVVCCGIDYMFCYLELVVMVDVFGGCDVIFDGEIVVFDEFGWLSF